MEMNFNRLAKSAFKALMVMVVMAVSAIAAEKVYLAPINITGMHSDYSIASTKLMKAYMEDDGRFILVVATPEDSVDSENQAAVRQKAVDKGCSKYIIAEFTRLGENVITSFKLYDVTNEAPVWSDRLKAQNPDDFDPIIQRVARNIGTNKKAVADDDIYSVTEQETKSPKRKNVSSYFGVGVGGFMHTQPEVDVAAGINLFILYDIGVMLFGLDCNMWGLSDNAKMTYVDFALSAWYPFGTRAIAPYVGGGLAYSGTEFDSGYDGYYYDDDYVDDSSSGLTGFVGGGVMLNRSSRVMFDARVRYMLNFYKNKIYETDDHDRITATKTHAVQGLVFGVSIGYGF